MVRLHSILPILGSQVGMRKTSLIKSNKIKVVLKKKNSNKTLLSFRKSFEIYMTKIHLVFVLYFP